MTRLTGPVGGPGLLVAIDRGSDVSLDEQIERSLREGIRAGRLVAGSRLPSSRALAAELGISRGVVTEAYGQLAAEGYLSTSQGAPVRVARTVRGPAPRARALPLLPSFPYHFHPGLPDLGAFPRDRWLRSLRAAWRQAPTSAVGYPDARGLWQLREALADYLGRVLGTASDPEHMMICGGFRDAFAMICRYLHSHGVERMALEDPGPHPHRLIIEQAGMTVVPVPVDAHGLDVEALTLSDVTAVVVTPAHQFPTGCVLSSERRAALLEWAEAGERLIIEDDLDAEYRYDGARLGALQGLAPERVAYIGSASKRLLPGMRLGWLLMPSWLTWPLISAKAIEDGGSEVIGQLALHDFISRGELDRHIRRMRLRYQHRHKLLIAAVARLLPYAQASNSAAGLYELFTLPRETDEAALLARAAECGVGLQGLSLHQFKAGGPPGLLLGFANLSEAAIEQGIRLLAEAQG
jgi:GntR family transcriptional regulator / MocR family aminotransferase